MARVTVEVKDKPLFKVGDVVNNSSRTMLVIDNQAAGELDVDDSEFVGVVLQSSFTEDEVGDVCILDKAEFSPFHGTIIINSD